MGVCFKGYSAIAKLLINSGADVNISNFNGATALIFAATFNKPEIAALLLAHGADKSAIDDKGNTALEHAKMQSSAAVLALLEA